MGDRRTWCAALAAATIAAAFAPIAGAAVSGGVITSTGPLTTVQTTPDLNCAVSHASDAHGEFFGTTACATLVAVDGTLYGPETIPAGGDATPRTTWSTDGQTSSGAGTAINPYRVLTHVSGGGLALIQTDTYVIGSESYGTRVAVTNTTSDPVTMTLYRAADCYLQDSDFGYGAIDAASGAVSCVAGTEAGSRIEQWAPLTSGSHSYEAGYSAVWAAIGAQQPFADVCGCSLYQDNGAGLSWTETIPAGATLSFSHLTAFSPTGTTEVADSDGDGFPDDWETPDGGVDTNGDGDPDLKLSDYGATSDRPDVFVQVGWTTTRSCAFRYLCVGSTNRRPSLAALRNVQRAFADHGVRLHVDAGPESLMNPDNGATWGSRSRAGSIEAPALIPGWNAQTESFDWKAAFDDYRQRLLPAERARLFHFALYVGQYNPQGSSGVSRSSTGSPFAGRDLIFARDVFQGGPNTLEESGTFMHELGHNLGLSHGGSVEEQSVNYKPNYPSVMNYAWQFSGTYKLSHLGLLDYSEGTLSPINEFALSETGGLNPDAAAADIATKWSCPDRTYKGPLPSMLNVDWNCNGQIDVGTVGTNVNNPDEPGNEDDPTFGEMHDHDDWQSLIFDGGGALGGAGDAAAPAPVTTSDEPAETELRAAAGDLQTVSFSGPGQLSVQSHTSAPVTLTLVNHRDEPRTYDLAVIAHGVALSGLPSHVTLARNETRLLMPTLRAGSASESAFFEVDASSDDPTDADSAITEVRVVDQAVSHQPKPPSGQKTPDRAGLVVIDDSTRAVRVTIDSGHARRLAAHAVGRTRAVDAGRHVVRISTTGRRPRTRTVSVSLRNHQLSALVVSIRHGRLGVRAVNAASGQRALLSLVPGTRYLRLGAHGRRVSVRHGGVLRLDGGVNTLTIGPRAHVRLGLRAQLTVLVVRGGRLVAVTRSAP